jgi:hypothetical protein
MSGKNRKVELFESEYRGYKIQVFTTRESLTDSFCDFIPWCYDIFEGKKSLFGIHPKRCKSKRSAISKAQNYIRKELKTCH